MEKDRRREREGSYCFVRWVLDVPCSSLWPEGLFHDVLSPIRKQRKRHNIIDISTVYTIM